LISLITQPWAVTRRRGKKKKRKGKRIPLNTHLRKIGEEKEGKRKERKGDVHSHLQSWRGPILI